MVEKKSGCVVPAAVTEEHEHEELNDNYGWQKSS